jgi:hypothetical protein
MSLKTIKLNAGFFSCCSQKLSDIIKFIKTNKTVPLMVDSTQLFDMYKYKDDADISNEYFEDSDHVENVEFSYPVSYSINYHWTYQFIDYSKLEYNYLSPLIKKYFSPSNKINEITTGIEQKYNFDFNNTVAVYYRGTDKKSETLIASFDEFYEQIEKVIKINKDITILIQTDTAQFIDYITQKNLKNIVVISENHTSYTDKGLHHERRGENNFNDMLILFSTMLIMSKCKYIICGSGNCSIWIMLYRGNNKNVLQYLNRKWYKTLD